MIGCILYIFITSNAGTLIFTKHYASEDACIKGHYEHIERLKKVPNVHFMRSI